MSQHYDFAHRLLVELVLNRPRERVERVLLGSTVDFFLEDLWDEAGDVDPYESAPDDDDAFMEALLAGELDRADELPTASTVALDDDTPAVLVTMPKPARTTEPYFCLVVLGARVRFFTLERSEDRTGDEGRPMLCEWVLEGGRRHVNYGDVDSADREAFLKAVRDIP